jgi:type IV pilus biogenesis protein CpaD/CtpE
MHRIAWLIGALVVSGCGYDLTDPYQRPGTYNPLGVNDANLHTMVANPHDLVEGTGTQTSAGAEAAPPVARMLAGKRYALPNLNAAAIDILNQQAPQGAANPGTSQ